MHQGQSEPRPHASRLRGEEHLERPPLHLIAHPDAVVRNADPHHAARPIRIGPHTHKPRPLLSSLRYRRARVHDQVQHRLRQPVRRHRDPRQPCRHGRHQPHMLRHRFRQERPRLRPPFRHVRPVIAGRVRVHHEVMQPIRQLLKVRHALLHRVEPLARPPGQPHRPRRVQVRPRRQQHVVHVMPQPGRERPDRRHPVRKPKTMQIVIRVPTRKGARTAPPPLPRGAGNFGQS